MTGSNLLIGEGYIGSAISKEIKCDVIDIGFDYKNIAKEFIDLYDNIILMAGHSSVKMCKEDPDGAWVNNVENFKRLLDMVDGQRLIYASSGSLYNGIKDAVETTNQFNLTSMYDLTKHTIDNLAMLSGKKVFGLRFGTVCGHSPKMRWDLMINKMFYSNPIIIANPDYQRSILGMKDLVRAVKVLLESDKYGIYNIASFTKKIGDIGNEVAKMQDKEIIFSTDSNAYNFTMDTSKFTKEFNFEFRETIHSIVRSL